MRGERRHLCQFAPYSLRNPTGQTFKSCLTSHFTERAAVAAAAVVVPITIVVVVVAAAPVVVAIDAAVAVSEPVIGTSNVSLKFD